MELLISMLAIGSALGAAVSLLAWIPPLRRMGQGSAPARTGIVVSVGSVAGMLGWLLVAYVGAQVVLVFSGTGVGDDFVNNQSYLVYDEDVLQNWDVIRRELWLRSLVPPPLRASCLTRLAIACQWADRLGGAIGDAAGGTASLAAWRVYVFGLLIGFGCPALVSGILAGYATRRKRVALSEPNTGEAHMATNG
jgi:hypothetical protein